MAEASNQVADPAFNIPRMTAKEYLELERDSPVKLEFVDGVVYAMAGASKRHNVIALDLRGLLRGKLSPPCMPYALDVKVYVHTAATERYYYPDVVVTCSELDNDAYIVRLPVLIVEVMSDSTKDFDRGEKFTGYRSLPSLQEYLLVDQDLAQIELLRKRTSWQPEQYGRADEISLESIKLQLPMRELLAIVGLQA